MYATIPGHSNYRISKDGVIISDKTGEEISQRVNKRTGYVSVTLYCGAPGFNKSRLVHRLVAQTYIENPKGLPEVNHKDLDKTNNHVENLEWCTAKDNQQHARANGAFSK